MNQFEWKYGNGKVATIIIVPNKLKQLRHKQKQSNLWSMFSCSIENIKAGKIVPRLVSELFQANLWISFKNPQLIAMWGTILSRSRFLLTKVERNVTSGFIKMEWHHLIFWAWINICWNECQAFCDCVKLFIHAMRISWILFTWCFVTKYANRLVVPCRWISDALNELLIHYVNFSQNIRQTLFVNDSIQSSCTRDIVSS